MNQVFKKILEDYKKANQAAKERMIKKYGFRKEADFIAFLGAVVDEDPASNPNSPVPNPTVRKGKKVVVVGAPPIMHNVYILDVSGSMMGGKIASALSGINEEVIELKNHADAAYTTQTLVDFSGTEDVRIMKWKIPIENMTTYNASTRGMTALLEAIGITLTKLLKDHKDGEKVLVKIFTDGEENNSAPEWKGNRIPELIKECEAKGFVITFVGTSNDVLYAINTLKVKMSNTLVHDNTEKGVKASFKKSIGSTVAYRAAASRGMDTQENFFDDSIK